MNRISFCHDIRDSFSFVRKENESLSLSLDSQNETAFRDSSPNSRNTEMSIFEFFPPQRRGSSSTLLSFENIFRSMIAPRDRNDNEKRIRSILLP